MVPIHPGRILRRELTTRRLSANALARALRVPSGRIVDIQNANAQSPLRPRCASAVISATLHNSGSTCRLSTISQSRCEMLVGSWSAKFRQPRDRAGWLQGRVRLTYEQGSLGPDRAFPRASVDPQVLTIIRPETLIHWHHSGFRCYWR